MSLDFDGFGELNLFFICSFSSQWEPRRWGGTLALGWNFDAGVELWRWGGTLALEWTLALGWGDL
jgi:hypothetical protein